jgi:thiol-disulfide isomerase/thioredoxin
MNVRCSARGFLVFNRDLKGTATALLTVTVTMTTMNTTLSSATTATSSSIGIDDGVAADVHDVIVHVNNEHEYFQALQNAKDKLIVVDIFATWCPPCRQIAPTFEALARQHHDTTVFIKIDIDVWPGVKRHLSVWAMPTFYFLKKVNSNSCQHECCQHHQQPNEKVEVQTSFSATSISSPVVIGSFMGANERLLRRGMANDGKIGMCSSMCTIQ